MIAKFGAVFDSYWAGGDYLPYDPEQFEDEQRPGRAHRHRPAGDPEPHRAAAAPVPGTTARADRGVPPTRAPPQPPRRRDRHRQDRHGALDYCELRERLDRSRLLFVAHREEILDQSLATFRYALRDPTFGEKWVGGARPTRFEHVFASIQSLTATDLDALPPDHFDVVIVDEFHHAAAIVLREGARPPRAARAARPHRDARAQRRPADPALVRRSHRRRAAPVGRDRPAAPRPVPLLRHPRRPRPARHPVAARTGLRDRGAHQPLHELRRLGPARRQAGRRSRRRRIDARPRVLREHRARPVHGPPLQPPRHPVGRRVGRQPPSRARGGAARPRRRHGEGRLLGRPVQRGCRRPQRRHGADAAPDREPGRCSSSNSAVDCARPRARRTAPCWTSSAPTARSSASTAATARCSAAPAATSSGRCRCSSRSCPPAATCNSTRRPQRSCCAASARPSRRNGRRRSTSCDHSAGNAPTSVSPSTWTSPASTSTTSTHGSELVRPARSSRRTPSCPPEHRNEPSGGPSADSSTSTTPSASPPTVSCSTGERPDVGALPERTRRYVHMLVAALADQALTKDTSLQDAVDLVWSHPQVLAELAELFGVLEAGSTTSTSRSPPIADAPLQIHARYSRIEILAAMGLGGTKPRSPRGRAASTKRSPPMPSCSPSPSTRAAVASHRRPATATTRSAAR